MQNLRVTQISRDHATLAWESPLTDGGSPVTSYTIEKRDVSKSTWLSGGSCDRNEMTFVVRKLFEGSEYLFRVAAENKIGTGEFVSTAKPVTAKLPFGKFCKLFVSTFYFFDI